MGPLSISNKDHFPAQQKLWPCNLQAQLVSKCLRKKHNNNCLKERCSNLHEILSSRSNLFLTICGSQHFRSIVTTLWPWKMSCCHYTKPCSHFLKARSITRVEEKYLVRFGTMRFMTHSQSQRRQWHTHHQPVFCNLQNSPTKYLSLTLFQVSKPESKAIEWFF